MVLVTSLLWKQSILNILHLYGRGGSLGSCRILRPLLALL